MALKSANQQGNTLIEFMIAALVGAMALAIVGTVFLSNQKAAAQRSKEIMLLQQMSSVMQQMKEDIQRAGFDGIATNSMMLSGSANILHQQANMIGYVYRKMRVIRVIPYIKSTIICWSIAKRILHHLKRSFQQRQDVLISLSRNKLKSLSLTFIEQCYQVLQLKVH